MLCCVERVNKFTHCIYSHLDEDEVGYNFLKGRWEGGGEGGGREGGEGGGDY